MKKPRQTKANKPVSRWKFAIETVAADPELNASAKFVYAVLAIHSYEGKISLGSRMLGIFCGMDKGTVALAVQTLKTRRHIAITHGKWNRNEMELLAMRSVEVEESAERGLLSGIAICPKCSEPYDVEANSLIPHVHEDAA